MPKGRNSLNKTSQKKVSDFIKQIIPELKGVDPIWVEKSSSKASFGTFFVLLRSALYFPFLRLSTDR